MLSSLQVAREAQIAAGNIYTHVNKLGGWGVCVCAHMRQRVGDKPLLSRENHPHPLYLAVWLAS